MEKGEHLKRQNRPTMLQLRYLQELGRVKKIRGAVGTVARRCKVCRSTVSRYFRGCIERGLLTEELEFTGQGEEWLSRYERLYENLCKYLQDIGVKKEEVEETTSAMAEAIDIHTLELILRAHTGKASIYRKKEEFFDEETRENLQRCRRHPVVFRFYRMDKRAGRESTSMAMRGFEELAEIVQKEEQTYLRLSLKEMSAQSRASGREMAGRLKSLKYEEEGLLKTAKTEKNQVYIPIRACKIHRWTGIGTMGAVSVTVTCSVGSVHMPESTALLYFWV